MNKIEKKRQQKKVNQQRSGSSERLIKWTNSSYICTKEKREKTLINKIRNKREIMMTTTEIQRTTQEYYERLHDQSR